MTRARPWILLCGLLSLTVLALPASAAREAKKTTPAKARVAKGASFRTPSVLKCWTSHEGLRECGNNVPPEYAQEGYSEISSTGVVREKARAPSQEEIEAARQRAEAERVARERFTERATQDRVLLSTFTNEGDVQLASNGKEAMFESRIKLVQTRVADLERNLARLSEHAAQEERSGKGMSPQLRSDLEQVERQIAEHRQFIVDQRHEQEQVRLKFATDLERFRALKSGKVKPGDP